MDVVPAFEELPGQWGNMKMSVVRAMRQDIRCLEARRGKDASGSMAKAASELGFAARGGCEGTAGEGRRDGWVHAGRTGARLARPNGS